MFISKFEWFISHHSYEKHFFITVMSIKCGPQTTIKETIPKDELISNRMSHDICNIAIFPNFSHIFFYAYANYVRKRY